MDKITRHGSAHDQEAQKAFEKVGADGKSSDIGFALAAQANVVQPDRLILDNDERDAVLRSLASDDSPNEALRQAAAAYEMRRA